MNEGRGDGGDLDEWAGRCAELEARLEVLLRRDAAYERLLRALTEVGEAVSRLRGRPFFDVLTAGLADAIGADAVLAGTLQRGEQLLRMSSGTVEGRRAAEFEQSLVGSPCLDVLSSGDLVLRDGADQAYPDDALIGRLHATGCAGVALRDADGEPIGMLLALFRHGIEDADLVRGLLRFFAARAAQELQQERSERRTRGLRRLMDSNAVGFVVADMAGKIVDANDAFLQTIGRDRDDLARGLRWPDITPPESLPVDLEALERLRHSGTISQREKEYVHKDGSRVSVLIAGAVLDAERGRAIALVIDQTERKRIERERLEALATAQEAREAAQEALRVRDQFLAVLSHELRNPLTPISTAVQLLQRLVPGEARLQNALNMIDRNVRHLGRLIDDLLDLARVTRGAMQLTRAPLSIGQLATEAVRAANEDAQRAGLSLQLHVQDEVWVDADSTRLNQIVMNLLGNAFKFTPAGGSVTVAVRRQGDRALLVVEDTGRGLDPELRARLFTPFVRGGDPAGRGLGIGLSIVRSIVELHGGRIWADSAGVGCGSRFTVELPAIPGPHPEPPPEPEVDADGPAVRILLVEADDDTREMLAAGLRLHGHEVVERRSSEETLRELPVPVADILLAELALPGMDGCELLRALREMPAWDHVPAVALTALGRGEDRQRSRAAGFAEHLVKPVDVGGLARVLRELARAAPRPEPAPAPAA